jgi:hypothetical protein
MILHIAIYTTFIVIGYFSLAMRLRVSFARYIIFKYDISNYAIEMFTKAMKTSMVNDINLYKSTKKQRNASSELFDCLILLFIMSLCIFINTYAVIDYRENIVLEIYHLLVSILFFISIYPVFKIKSQLLKYQNLADT